MKSLVHGLGLSLLLGFAALSSPVLFAAEAPSGLRQQGDREFRAGHFERAAALYREARALGDDSARLHYNLGVASYRAGKYSEAIESLRLAARDGKIAPLAWYNRGLAYWALGDRRSAEPCFEWTQRLARGRRLRSLAARALADVRAGTRMPQRRRKPILEPRPGPSVVAMARFGYDDNVFYSPDEAYVDLAQRTRPLVEPKPQSGTFTEAQVYAAGIIRTRRGNVVRAAYDFQGRHYTDSTLDAADEHSHRLSLSTDASFGVNGRNRLRSRTYVGQHKEINYDPDTGLERIAFTGESLSDRFSYLNAGSGWNFDHAIGTAIVGARSEVELREYESVTAVSEYDNLLLLGGIYVQWPLADATRVHFEYDRFRRDYDDRHARGPTGLLSAFNPMLEYDYERISARASFDLGSRAFVRVTADGTQRQDNFSGYGDYDSLGVKMEAAWRVSRQLRLDGSISYRDYDYPNAFAYDVPAGGARTLESVSAMLGLQLRLWRRLSLSAAVRLDEVSSSDKRFDYSRLQIPVGAHWVQRF